MQRRTCTSCGKPLAGTLAECHECGGETYRGGDEFDGREWKVMLGVKPTYLEEVYGGT